MKRQWLDVNKVVSYIVIVYGVGMGWTDGYVYLLHKNTNMSSSQSISLDYRAQITIQY